VPLGIGTLGRSSEMNSGGALDVTALHHSQVRAFEHCSSVQKSVLGESPKGAYCYRQALSDTCARRQRADRVEKTMYVNDVVRPAFASHPPEQGRRHGKRISAEGRKKRNSRIADALCESRRFFLDAFRTDNGYINANALCCRDEANQGFSRPAV
jgi:hypothetical protein